jgi:putative PIG3 family NAD(P)H quinone oxidoreductase
LAGAGGYVTFGAMKAIVVHPESHDLTWQDVPEPTIAAGQVLVEIHATAVNRADLLQRIGQYPPPPGESEILGLEMSGVIRDVADDVADWTPGDRVCALLGGGGYAERVAVDARQLLPVPEGWRLDRAAAVPEVFLTAWVNLFREAGLQAGESVLIHAGASGVGTAAIQLAREAGCRPLVTAGGEAKRQRCRELGAEFVCDYKETDFADEVLAHLRSADPDATGVDVVLDVGAASHLERNLRVLGPGGRLVLIALLGGAAGEIDLGQVLRKRLRLIGSTLRSRPVAEKGDIIAAFRAQFWEALVAGRIEPVIDRVIPVQQAAEAHDVIAGNCTIGKVILHVRDE